MQKRCKISIKKFEFEVIFKKSITSDLIWRSLPIFSKVKRWGEEIYFYTEIKSKLEPDAKDVVKLGEIAYWPSGGAIAIGFGKTPLSLGEEIRLASKCNIWGKTSFDLKKLKNIHDNETISLERIT